MATTYSFLTPERQNQSGLAVLQLEQAGIRCWIAPRDVRLAEAGAAKSYVGWIRRVMILLLSASSNRSRPVIKVGTRLREGDRHHPCPTKGRGSSDALEFLSSDQWFDAITPPLESHLDRMAMVIKEYLAEGATDVARPTAPEPMAKEDANKTPVTAGGRPP
jgi:hypothetical protein